jgi:hypothetical protein
MKHAPNVFAISSSCFRITNGKEMDVNLKLLFVTQRGFNDLVAKASPPAGSGIIFVDNSCNETGAQSARCSKGSFYT